MMIFWTRLLAASTLAWVFSVGAQIPNTAQNPAEQLFFVGKALPSQDGNAVVALRWDVVEGQLPADIQQFQLKRDGTVIATLNRDGYMDTAAVNALYNAPEFARQRAEALARLQRLNQTPPEFGGVSTAVNSSNLSSVLLQKLQDDPSFGALAMKLDVVTAAAAHRGYIDRPSHGSYTYELLAVNASSNTARLGKLVINTQQNVLNKPPQGFDQLLLGRCDAPESGLDHGAVALTWRHGGDNLTERYAQQLQSAGFELWRSTAPLAANIEQAPATDIGLLTRNAALAPDGTPVLPGLTLVTPQPVIVATDGTPDTPDAAEYYQPADEARQQGLLPGQRYAYYLVERDFSGSYGHTVAHVVTIPDRLSPPAPWNVNVADSSLDEALYLEWDAVNLSNYLRAHQDQRQFCNLDTAAAEGQLRYASAGKSCADDSVQISLNLNVASYRVYRFDNFDDAARFSDRDGDGVADALERGQDGSSGMACDAQRQPPNVPNRRVDNPAQPVPYTTVDGRKKLRFTDPAPQAGQVLWYRVAAMGGNQVISALSEPIRARFADRLPPTPPSVDDVQLIAPASCHYSVTVTDKKGVGLTLINSANRDATRATLSCGANEPASVTFGSGDALLDRSQCESLINKCGNGTPTLAFEGASNQVLAQSSNRLLRNCGADVRLTAQACRPAGPIDDGAVLNQPPGLQIPDDQCVALYREVDGESFRLGTQCPGQPQIDLNNLGLSESESICLSAAYQGDNGRSSPRTRLPCFVLESSEPQTLPPPTPITLNFSNNTAEIAWLLPQMPVSGTLLELTREGGGDNSVVRGSAAHPDGQDSDEAHTASLALPAALNPMERWCVRLKAVGVPSANNTAGAVSAASAPLCAARDPAGELDFLGWPQIPLPPEQAPLDVLYLDDIQLPVLRLGTATSITQPIGFCQQPHSPTLGKSGLSEVVEMNCALPAARNLCARLRQDLSGSLNFVAYRQERRRSSDAPSDFVQVSPLIDRAFCEVSAPANCPNGNCTATTRLNDPYIGMVKAAAPPAPEWALEQFVFMDSYPHLPGMQYRYQLIYFDQRGEVTHSRTSPWMETQ